MAGEGIMFYGDQILFDESGNIVFDCPDECCPGGFTPGDDCEHCTGTGTTPAQWDIQVMGLDCCYGGAVNAVWRVSQIGDCQWTYFEPTVAGGFELQLSRDGTKWTLSIIFFLSGDSFSVIFNQSSPGGCSAVITFPTRAQPPSFGACAACKDNFAGIATPV